MKQSIRGASVVFLALACVGAAGVSCKPKADPDKLEKGIRETLEEKFAGLIEAVDCPDDLKLKQGDKFKCSVTLKGGGTMTVDVTQEDDEGNVRWIVSRTTVLPVGVVVESIQKRLVEKLGGGVAVTVDCGAGPFLGGSAGATFECTASAPDKDPLLLVVTQQDDMMNFSWKPKGAEGGLAEVVQGAMGQSPPPAEPQP
jgi:hypothetical protein